MSSGSAWPTEVLSQALADTLAGRRVLAGVFTTFRFDPSFFELHVLPLLFDQPFSQVDKVRRIQLEDALRELPDLAVYYDRRGLAQDAEPAQLDVRRIDVSRTHGFFHPKLILLLVEDDPDPEEEDDADPPRSLLVGIQSANLTRAGWWENVECGHFEEIPSADRSDEVIPFRQDLLALLLQVRRSAPEDEDHTALDRIHRFLRDETSTATHRHARVDGVYRTRLFCGQGRQSLPGWLADLGLGREDWNLEVVSPYFDAAGAAPLEALVEALGAVRTRVLLPRELDGAAGVTERCHDAVAEIAGWAELRDSLVRRSGQRSAQKQPPRRVHAKLYRLWNHDGLDVLIVGSVNLTSAAFSSAQAGNLEAAFLVDVSGLALPRRWLLSHLEKSPERFTETQPAEEEGIEEAPVDLSLRFDWARRRLAYRLHADVRQPFRILETSGELLHAVEKPQRGEWVELPEAVGERAATLLLSTSFLRVEHPQGSWRVLVREEGMGHRPSLLLQLTPEEILEYWALLTPDQRAAFLEARIVAEVEGLDTHAPRALLSRNTLFDRFAGIYHAFGCLRRHVDDAIAEGREREAEARLLGAKYDSVPELLRKSLESEQVDPIVRYVTFLCARQLREDVARAHPDFLGERLPQAARLDALLARLPEVRDAVAGALEEPDAFLAWYEEAFVKDARPPRGAA